MSRANRRLTVSLAAGRAAADTVRNVAGNAQRAVLTMSSDYSCGGAGGR
jgi:hypothetical protein